MRRVARLLMDITNKLMPVRCGLLLVPSAAVERLVSEGGDLHGQLPVAQHKIKHDQLMGSRQAILQSSKRLCLCWANVVFS